MAVGFPTDKPNIDGRVGHLAVTVCDSLAEVSRIKAWLDGRTDAELIALGYTQPEVTALKSAFTDLDKLSKIATGQATQAEANDFFFWARHLTGLN